MKHLQKYGFVYSSILLVCVGFFILNTRVATTAATQKSFQNSQTCITIGFLILLLITHGNTVKDFLFTKFFVRWFLDTYSNQLLETQDARVRQELIDMILSSKYSKKEHLEAVIKNTEGCSKENDLALDKLSKLVNKESKKIS